MNKQPSKQLTDLSELELNALITDLTTTVSVLKAEQKICISLITRLVNKLNLKTGRWEDESGWVI